MRPGERALAAEGRDDGGLEAFRELPELLGRVGPDDSAPAMIAGRSARDSRSAATAVSSGRGGSSSGKVSPPVTTGTAVSARRTSCGISTHTGPCGTVSADVHASAMADGIWDWVRTVWTDFTTPRKDAAWSGSSCR